MHFRDANLPVATLARPAAASVSSIAALPALAKTTIAQPLQVLPPPTPVGPVYAPGSSIGAASSVPAPMPPPTAPQSLQVTVPVSSLLASTATTAQIISAVNAQAQQLQAMSDQIDQMNYNRTGWWGGG